jgi:hypothetical protein
LPDKGDVVDWHKAGGTKEQFASLIGSASDYTPEESAGPQPLMRPLPPPEPFPLEALGTELAGAAQAICDVRTSSSRCASDHVATDPVPGYARAPRPSAAAEAGAVSFEVIEGGERCTGRVNQSIASLAAALAKE